MERADRLRAFVRVAELASFTQAAQALDWPKASVSLAVQQLEAELGTRLLHRTTRRVQLTQDGMVFFERSKDLLADFDDLHALFQAQDPASLRGRVRVDMTTGMARNVVIPALPDLLAQHPHLELEISSTERRVDLVREGFDCVLRAGPVGDTSLVARPLPPLAMINCLSPGYIARHGQPQSLADLPAHRIVHYVANLGGRSPGFEYVDADGNDASVEMPGAVTVNNAEAYQAACLAGLGLIQAPAIGLRDALRDGRLVAVLPALRAHAMPLTLVYAHRRNQSPRVRVVMDWLVEVVTAYIAATPDTAAVSPSR